MFIGWVGGLFALLLPYLYIRDWLRSKWCGHHGVFHFERNLTSSESEPPAKLQKKVTEVEQQTAFHFPLLRTGGER